MSNLALETIKTPVGTIQIYCTDNGVKELKISWQARSGEFGQRRENRKSGAAKNGEQIANNGRTPATRIASQARRELQEYFAGRRREFSVPLDMAGTVFQKKVWRALSEIPYGEVRSYGQIARSVKNPKASRAVGTANGSNPVAIIVPCHRVIAGDGSLGGYGGGLTNKTYLLSLEQTACRGQA